LRTFAIPTGEDPDKISSAELDLKAKYIDKVDQKSLEKEILRVGGNVEKWVTYLAEKFPKSPPKSLETITPKQYKWSMSLLEKQATKAAKNE